MPVKHHKPKFLPPKLDYGKFAKELASAQYAIGLLQGSQKTLHNASHLIGPLVAKEAEVSSKIEGTQSTSKDIYLFDAGGKPRHVDTPVVSNYRLAMSNAVIGVKQRKRITKTLIKQLHSTLLTGVRNKGRLGEFRNDDVWIAEKEGDPINKALYVPPEHMHIDPYIENILEYIEKDKDDLNLVKAGVIHYQFEAVHPFEDGNGRIGRLLIPLILFYNGELSLPIIYSSGYFEARPNQYRQALRDVDTTGEFEPWLKFFLVAIAEQAKDTLKLIDSIQALNIELRKKYEATKSPYMHRLIDFLFEQPVISPAAVRRGLNIPNRMTALRLVDSLCDDGVLTKLEGEKGPGGTELYLFTDLLDLIG